MITDKNRPTYRRSPAVLRIPHIHGPICVIISFDMAALQLGSKLAKVGETSNAYWWHSRPKVTTQVASLGRHARDALHQNAPLRQR